jgi:pimeloyl-ACP methyl ester carboxylesterase
MARTLTPSPSAEAHDLSMFEDGTSAKARYAMVEGIRVFYREAGRSSAPTLLLLHGFPTSSHMYRTLIPILATRYHVIAPDMPGFGFTEAPDRNLYQYTFDSLARTMDAFMEALELPEYAIQVFDYGAPVGFRLALAHPDRITALISQNGNAYEEGLSAGWDPIQRYWRDPSPENRSALRSLLTPESVKWQYTHGVADVTRIAPECYVLDSVLLTRPQVDEIQLDLFLDYASNVALYPAFQQYFRSHEPPLLAVWGQNDPFFLPPGANAFQRDIRNAEVHFYDTGHFALETHCQEIGATIIEFLDWTIP